MEIAGGEREMKVGIRVRLVNGKSEKTVEKFFKSESARDKWIDQQDEKGKLIQIVGWCNETTPGFGWQCRTSRLQKRCEELE